MNLSGYLFWQMYEIYKYEYNSIEVVKLLSYAEADRKKDFMIFICRVKFIVVA